MESKKSNQANLEAKRPIFFQIGILLALSACLVAFEWTGKSENKLAVLDEGGMSIGDITEVKITRPEKEPEPIKPPKEQHSFEEVPDETKLEKIIERIDNLEIGEGDLINDDPFDLGEELVKEKEIFVVVEKMPTFRGKGLSEFRNYVMKHVTYPEEPRRNNVEGKVTVQFVVDEKGKVINVLIPRSPHQALSEEVRRVLENAPADWEPGVQRTKKVKVMMCMDIHFILD